jgi:GntR family transcriptional regulator
LIGAELRPSTEAEALALRLGPGSRVVAIDRVRLADGQPMAIDSCRLTPDLVSVLAYDLENGSLHQALRELGKEPAAALAWISARLATTNESKLLRLPTPAAVLVERRIISDRDGKPFEFTTSVYNADRYVIDAIFTLSPALSAPIDPSGDKTPAIADASSVSPDTHPATRALQLQRD